MLHPLRMKQRDLGNHSSRMLSNLKDEKTACLRSNASAFFAMIMKVSLANV